MIFWNSCCGSAETNVTDIQRMQVRSLASLSGLRIRCCRELQCRLQMLLGSCVAVAATALIQPLVWDPPYTTGVTLKR